MISGEPALVTDFITGIYTDMDMDMVMAIVSEKHPVTGQEMRHISVDNLMN